MNHTAAKTNITISTANARVTSKYAIKKRVEFDAWGRARVVETVRGIRI